MAAVGLGPVVFQSEVMLGWCPCPLAHPCWRCEVAAPRASRPRPCGPVALVPACPAPLQAQGAATSSPHPQAKRGSLPSPQIAGLAGPRAAGWPDARD